MHKVIKNDLILPLCKGVGARKSQASLLSRISMQNILEGSTGSVAGAEIVLQEMSFIENKD